jgi:hypothetical protein
VATTTATAVGTGAYSVSNLKPGDYLVCETQKASWTQSQPDPSSSPVCGAPVTGNPSGGGYAFTLTSGQSKTVGDIGNYRNATITVTKYNDRNGNHQQDAGEPTLQGWTFFVDGNGNGSLDAGETKQVTGSSGQATLSVKPASGYQICEVSQSTWFNTDPGTALPCKQVGALSSGGSATLKFGNRQTATTGAKTIGYWQNKNGQALITGASSTNGVCKLTSFLRQYNPFQDLSSTATCAQVATYVTNVIKAANSSGSSMNQMLKAQMLATALDVYFSDPALGGNKLNAPAPIGGLAIDLTMICSMIDGSGGSATCSGSFTNVSSVFGGAPSLTVSQMLAYAAGQSNSGGGTWYANVKTTQEKAKNAFDAINNEVAFIAP